MFLHSRRNRKVVFIARTHQHKKQGPALRSEDQTPSSVFYYYISFAQKSKCIFDRLKVFQLSFPLLQNNSHPSGRFKKEKKHQNTASGPQSRNICQNQSIFIHFSTGPVCAQGSPANFIPPSGADLLHQGGQGNAVLPGDTKCWPCGPRPRTGTLPESGIQSR